MPAGHNASQAGRTEMKLAIEREIVALAHRSSALWPMSSTSEVWKEIATALIARFIWMSQLFDGKPLPQPNGSFHDSSDQ